MALNKGNAAPDVTAATVTGQHLCNDKVSIANRTTADNKNFSAQDTPAQGSSGAGAVESSVKPGTSDTSTGSLREISMTELYDQVYEPKAPVVDGLFYPGTYIFAGSPKVGKSFFMAQLAYHVAAGIQLWDYPVRQGSVLYLALEDDYARLQKRLSRMFDVEGNDHLYLAIEAGTMADGLEAQMDQFIRKHPDTALIIIDTLQRIREIGGEQYSYSKDYEMIKSLKGFADKHSICFLIVHHTRKMEADDSFDMISGTNGLLGAADGAFVLKKKKRTDRTAVLSIVGRDQQDQELKLEFDQEKCFWKFVSAENEPWKEPPDPVLAAIDQLLSENENHFEGTPTELSEKLGSVSLPAPHALTRKLNVNAGRVFNDYGIVYECGRTGAGRYIRLSRTVDEKMPEEHLEKTEL